MRAKGAIIFALCGALCGPVAAQSPLSAIEWLTEVPSAPVLEEAARAANEPAVTRGITTETITVTPLDGPTPDAVGLLPSRVTGLPATLWGPSSSSDLSAILATIQPTDLLPATRELLFTLLLAELEPPIDSAGRGTLFLARIDTLNRLGAVESAAAMLERAGIEDPERFDRWFDLSLLLGTEDQACEKLVRSPSLTRSLPARVFCLARSGDWSAAALSFETGAVLGSFSRFEEAVLLRFLDPELGEDTALLPPSGTPSPLLYHLYDAVGEPIGSRGMPLGFAFSDLRGNAGWKVQIEAAERLARFGALPANKLLGLYTERRPAASGGVWDRVSAIQDFDKAVLSRQDAQIDAGLPELWDQMHEIGLEPTVAGIYADRLGPFSLSGEANALAFKLGLLTLDYETVALRHNPENDIERFYSAVAKGLLDGVPTPSARAEAIVEGFQAKGAPQQYAALIRDGALGEAVLQGIKMFGDGAEGDLDRLADAIALFRALGLEDAGRRAALQVMILDRRG